MLLRFYLQIPLQPDLYTIRSITYILLYIFVIRRGIFAIPFVLHYSYLCVLWYYMNMYYMTVGRWSRKPTDRLLSATTHPNQKTHSLHIRGVTTDVYTYIYVTLYIWRLDRVFALCDRALFARTSPLTQTHKFPLAVGPRKQNEQKTQHTSSRITFK